MGSSAVICLIEQPIMHYNYYWKQPIMLTDISADGLSLSDRSTCNIFHCCLTANVTLPEMNEMHWNLKQYK